VAVTLELTGVRGSRLITGVSPLAELMSCLHVLTEPGHHPHQQRWASTTSARLPPHLVASLRRFAPLWARYRCRILLPSQTTLDWSLDQELQELAGLPIEDVAEHVAYALLGNRVQGYEAILTDTGLQAELLHESARRSLEREELALRLLRDAEAVRRDLLEFLAACQDAFFGEFWSHVHVRLSDAAKRLHKRLRTEPLGTVVASLGPASRILDDPPQVIFDKLQHAHIDLASRLCLIVPSVQTYPHVLIKDDEGWPLVVHTPLNPNENVQGPSLSDMRRRLVVLSDERRLELCRHLANEAITTTRLSERTGMSSAQVSRHIGRLRDAGLVVSSRDGRLVYHRLSTDVINRLGVDLLGTIVR
jgi:DNA-binding transcriptional ArsR family regulator